jgi:MtN3 and saliva related transmembrane protein
MNELTTVVGTLSAIGTTAAWLPQVIKTWKTGTARDFSWLYLALFSSGVTGWQLYGFLKRDWVIIAANGVTLLLVLTVVFVKAKERHAARGL